MLSPGSRRRALGVVLVGLTGLAVAGGALTAQAQVLPVPTSSTTTTRPPSSTTTTAPRSTTSTTAAPSSTTTTTRPGPFPLTPTTTSTTVPSAPAAPGSPGTPPPSGGGGDQAPPAASPETGDGGGAPTGAGPFPAELQALMNSVHRTPANNTKKLLFALSPLLQYGLSEQQAAIVGFGRFPVAGLASYSHDWWFPRFGPGWRLHEGTDIFAARGTPVRAPVDGTVKIHNGGLGGLSVYVVQPDRTYWYMAHLESTAAGLVEGASVKTGDVVGYVGDSGNARGGPTHCHFEVHPGGGGPIDPKAVLDQFISDALAMAPKVVASYAAAAQAGTPAQVAPAPAPVPKVATAALSPRAALLWTAAVSPTGGAIHFAEAEAARAASSIDWSRQTSREGVGDFDRRMAHQLAVWWVQPLVPPLLARYLG